MTSLLEGFTLGLAFAAPIGAQNIYVIRSAATAPLRLSLRVAAVVSLTDVSLGLACLFGLGALLTAAPWLTTAIILLGAGFLLYIGVRLIFTDPQPTSGTDQQDTGESAYSWFRIAGAAMVLTWLNPHALMDGAVILGGFRAHLDGPDVYRFALGMAGASLLWFHAVTLGVGSLRAKFSDTTMLWVNRTCGVLLCGLGVQLAGTLLR